MAGKEVFIGEIMESMIEKLSTIDTMITELQNINTTVAQGVTAVNIKPGTAHEITVTESTVQCGVNSSATTDSFRCFADGVVRFNGTVQAFASGSDTVGMILSKSIDNGSTWTQLGVYNTTQNVLRSEEFNFDIAVSKGNQLKFGVQTPNISGAYMNIQAGAKLKYDLLDVVNGGSFVKA